MIRGNRFKYIFAIYHLLFFFVGYYYTTSNPKQSDGEKFYELASTQSYECLFEFGTKFMGFVIKPLVSVGVSYFFLCLIFSLISLKGFFLLLNLLSLKEKKPQSLAVAILLVFALPSWHFWMSFISKDVLLFTFMAYLLSAVINDNWKKPALYILFVFSLMARPHAALVILAITTVYIISSKIADKKIKITVLSASVASGILATYLFIRYFLRIESFNNLNNVFVQFYNNIRVYHSDSGSHHYDVFETTLLEKISILLFRPLFFDAKGILQTVASLENVFIIFLIIYLLFNASSQKVKESLHFRFVIATVFLLTIVTSLYIYNLGQANRIRWMILPYLFFALFLILKNDLISKNKVNV